MRQAFLQRTKTILDNRLATFIIILLAVCCKSVIANAYTSLGGDKALYLLLAKGLLASGRMAEPVWMAETGALQYLYEPAMHSPFYSLLAAPVLWLTNSYYWTQAILTVVSWVLFYGGLYAVAKIVFRHHWLTNLFLFCSAFFLYPHELSSTVKDTFGAGFTLVAIALMHRWLQQPQWQTTVLMALCLLSLSLTKLLYVPLAIVLVFLLLVFVLLQRSRQHLLFFCLLLLLLFAGGFLTNQLLFAPAKELVLTAGLRLPANTINMTVGFSPQNLLATFPFVSSSLINTHLWAVQLGSLPGFSFSLVMRSFLYIDAIVLVLLFVTSLYYSRQLLSERFLLFPIMAAFTMTAVVVMLSLMGNVVQYKSTSALWTYVMDARSFLVPMLVLQLLLFRFLFLMRSLPLVRAALMLLFFLTIAHGIYFTAKETRLLVSGTKKRQGENAFEKIAATLSQQDSTRQMLITSDNFLRRYVQVNNLPAYALASLPAGFSWMQKGQRFLIATYPEDSFYLQKFPPHQLQPLDSLPPFHLHSYQVK
ncbi:MAG TPA: hypothetical protein VMR70_06415 [Flavisolibacter sp.]|nr:hypothetical protein [Flavisolibacter sp.]